MDFSLLGLYDYKDTLIDIESKMNSASIDTLLYSGSLEYSIFDESLEMSDSQYLSTSSVLIKETDDKPQIQIQSDSNQEKAHETGLSEMKGDEEVKNTLDEGKKLKVNEKRAQVRKTIDLVTSLYTKTLRQHSQATKLRKNFD